MPRFAAVLVICTVLLVLPGPTDGTGDREERPVAAQDTGDAGVFLQPKLWALRNELRAAYAESGDPTAKMRPDDRNRFLEMGNESVDVILWVIGRPVVDGPAGARVVSDAEKQSISEIHAIEWASVIFPMVVLDVVEPHVVERLARIESVYLIEIEDEELNWPRPGGLDPRPTG